MMSREELEERVRHRPVQDFLRETIDKMEAVRPGAKVHVYKTKMNALRMCQYMHANRNQPEDETIAEWKRRAPVSYSATITSVHEAMREFGIVM